MKRFASALIVLLFVGLLSAPASAQGFNFQMANLTASGGDPNFPIATDLTFNNLLLNVTFANNSTSRLSLFDSTGAAQTSLDTLTAQLQSALQPLTTANGNITGATLTGQFSTTSISLLTSFGGNPINATINSGFSATLTGNPIYGLFTTINAADTTSGATYSAGTFGTTSVSGVDPVPSPEAGTLLLCIAVVPVVVRIIRRRIA